MGFWDTTAARAAGGITGTLASVAFGRRSRKSRRRKRLIRSIDNMGAIAQTEGWGPEMEPIATRLGVTGLGDRALQQQAEFWARPGAYRTMSLLDTLLSMERPEFFGTDYENAARRAALAGYEANANQVRQRLMDQLAAFGAAPEASIGLETQIAQGRASLLDQLSSQLQEQRAASWDTEFGQKANLLQLLANFINQQQAAPYVVKSKTPSRILQYLGALGGAARGIGSIIGAL